VPQTLPGCSQHSHRLDLGRGKESFPLPNPACGSAVKERARGGKEREDGKTGSSNG